MDFFNLPVRTKVGRVIPKNAFDEYVNTKQKKLFTDCIQRILWTHKLSADTVNLDAKDIQEIQVFKVELKQKSDILKILKILKVVDTSIPYHIIFWVEYDKEFFISTSSKHPHPTSDEIAVIDWTFHSTWLNKLDNPYELNLSRSIDHIFKVLTAQISGTVDYKKKSITEIVVNQQEIDRIKKEISRTKAKIKNSKQFNKKVDLNLKLKALEQDLKKVDRK